MLTVLAERGESVADSALSLPFGLDSGCPSVQQSKGNGIEL